MSKRYYWLRLKDDFFSSKRIKKLRKLAGGDTYTIIYLKLQLLAMKTDGIIKYTGLEEDFADELALDIDEEADNVRVTLSYLLSTGLAETSDNVSYFFPYAVENTGSEVASTKRSRECRARKKATLIEAENAPPVAEKAESANDRHLIYIDDHANQKRYGGNYYLVYQRDQCKCAICGGDDFLCVHHIDGYDEGKPQNNDLNRLVLLCRKCHSNIHAGRPIPRDVLDRVGYCNAGATLMQRECNGEKEIEKEIEQQKERKGKQGKESDGDPVLDLLRTRLGL